MSSEGLSLFSDVIQIMNYIENANQTTNGRLLAELQHQNQDYLEGIIERLDMILTKLEV